MCFRQTLRRRDDREDAVGQRAAEDGGGQGARVGCGAVADDDDLLRGLQQFVAVEQGGQGEEAAIEFAGEGRDHLVGTRAIAVFAGEIEEPREHADERAVARRRGVVGRVLRAQDDVGGIVGREEIAAAVLVPVVGVEQIDPFLRLSHIAIQLCRKRLPTASDPVTKAKAALAAASHDGCSKTCAAFASAAIIRPFQSASTLSSQPGRTRFALMAKSVVRAVARRASVASSRRLGLAIRLRMLWPSQLPPSVTS